MRIKRCKIEAFGQFRDYAIEDLGHPLVVVEGANEAGKTTFFHFLQTMLYGIYPVDAEQHKYHPHDGSRLEGSLTFSANGGEESTIARRLMSTPSGRLVTTQGESEIRNREIPLLEHISKPVFEAVYALGLHDMITLKGGASDEIQDRLLSGLSIHFIRSAREVVGQLEDEANSLWRPDNRGKPKTKELEGDRKQLIARADHARQQDASLRHLIDERAAQQQQLTDLEEEQVQLKARYRQAERLAPVRRQLLKIASLREEAGSIAQYETMPEELQETLDEVTTQIADLDQQFEENERTCEEKEAICQALTKNDGLILDHKESIDAWTRKIAAHETIAAQRDQYRRDEEQESMRIQEHARRLLSVPWQKNLAEPILHLSEPDLRQQLRMYEDADEQLRQGRARAETMKLGGQVPKRLLPWAGVSLVGGVLILLGVQLPMDLLWSVGAVLLGVGGMGMYMGWTHNQSLTGRVEPLDLDRLEQEHAVQSAAIEALLRDIPIPQERARRPDHELIADLQSLKNALFEHKNIGQRKEEVEEQVEAEQAEIGQLTTDCRVERTSSPSETVALLHRQLQAAEERRDRAGEAQTHLDVLQVEQDVLIEKRGESQKEKERMESLLKDVGDGDIEDGIDRLNRRREAARQADLMERTLHQEHPDWEEIQSEIDMLAQGEEAWTFTDEEHVRNETRLDRIEEEIRDRSNALASSARDIEHLQEEETPDAIESAMVHLDAQLADVKMDRDRLILLRNIIHRADHQFRMTHQPGVIRLASEYLHVITGGRYERLIMDEGSDDLQVYERGAHFPVVVGEPLSRGTRDQIFLAIRLAVVEQLDVDQEKLPLFLDEVLVNWDGERRRCFYDIAQKIAAKRQVFFFTCHRWLADEIVEQMAGHRLPLSAV